jgi:hypothetical protein
MTLKHFIKVNWRPVVVVLYGLSAFSFSVPEGFFPPKPVFTALASRSLITLNLWQYWDMFAPNPRSDDVKIEVAYETKSGQKTGFYLTDMISMPYGERWQKERWRKYFNDHLRVDQEKHLWLPYAKFASRELRRQGIDTKNISLVRYWRPTSYPLTPQSRASQNSAAWLTYNFFDLVVDSPPEGEVP